MSYTVSDQRIYVARGDDVFRAPVCLESNRASKVESLARVLQQKRFARTAEAALPQAL